MDKKVTTTIAGIALGASLLAGAGYGIYKWFKKKNSSVASNGQTGGGHTGKIFTDYIGNGLVKSNSLYGNRPNNDLVGGGLFLSPSGNLANG